MEELVLNFNKKSPQDKERVVDINIENNTGKNLIYKLLLGTDGVWNVLRDYDDEANFLWKPEQNGKYFIMVQAKEKDSKKSFEYIKREECTVNSTEEKIIGNIHLDKEKLNLGEKLNIDVETKSNPIMFKYWISGKDGWQLIKDFSVDNKITVTANEVGKHQVLVECKKPDSENNFDDFETKDFQVDDIVKPEIINFKCLSLDLLVGEELTFQVDSKHDESRTILYKFLKIYEKGEIICIQDYSSKKRVSFIEKKPGEYKLLCLAKDMYSNKPYDDRALMVYEIKDYNPIEITKFTTDFNSPQMNGTKILLKAVCTGGNNLLYRFKINGNYSEDSGYIKNNTYLWETKHEGDYKITLWVKDESFEGDFEQEVNMEYSIEKKSLKPIKIVDIILNKQDNHLINEVINVKVIAEGELNLKYSFIIYKDRKEIERTDSGSDNWVEFTPKYGGEYEIEIRIKDRLSAKEYDCHQFISFKVKEYIEGKIDYVLVPSKEFYLVGDNIELEAICQNTGDTLIKYVISLDGRVIEEIDYTPNKKLIVSPKRSGKYIIDLFAKNVRCKKDFDNKKQVKIYINDTPPVTNTKIYSDKTYFNINEEASFYVKSNGGREVCYEFYIMENREWKIVQKYSRKNYYAFIPFSKGVFKMLVLSKSFHKKLSYEDYDVIQFTVAGENKMAKFIN